MYAVVVTFTLKPGHRDAFLPLVLSNAAMSRSEEVGCHRFDVCTNPSRQEEVFLYEIYTDRDAFDAHLNSLHFAAFDAATGDMIQAKSIATYEQVHQ